ncbi:hypothetical protein ABTK62_20675, partial [Acinetobacter baumannii]
MPRNAGCVSEQCVHRGDLPAAAVFLLNTSMLTDENCAAGWLFSIPDCLGYRRNSKVLNAGHGG